ncbi:unnamed protein product [Prunus armeniaca]
MGGMKLCKRNVLDPKWKLALLKISFRNLGAEHSKDETIGDEVKSVLLTLYNEYKWVGNLGPLQTLDEGHEEGLEDELDGDDAHSRCCFKGRRNNKWKSLMKFINTLLIHLKTQGTKTLTFWIGGKGINQDIQSFSRLPMTYLQSLPLRLLVRMPVA